MIAMIGENVSAAQKLAQIKGLVNRIHSQQIVPARDIRFFAEEICNVSKDDFIYFAEAMLSLADDKQALVRKGVSGCYLSDFNCAAKALRKVTMQMTHGNKAAAWETFHEAKGMILKIRRDYRRPDFLAPGQKALDKLGAISAKFMEAFTCGE